jgi:hypothetical protein
MDTSDKKQTSSVEAPEMGEISALDDRAPSPTMEELKNPTNGDEALKAFDSVEEIYEIDATTNRRLLRKIDWNILPL